MSVTTSRQAVSQWLLLNLQCLTFSFALQHTLLWSKKHSYLSWNPTSESITTESEAVDRSISQQQISLLSQSTQITKYILNLMSKALQNIHNYRRMFAKVVLAHRGRDGYWACSRSDRKVTISELCWQCPTADVFLAQLSHLTLKKSTPLKKDYYHTLFIFSYLKSL